MPRTLYVSDMDGTLLGNDARVSADTARILRRLNDSGIMFSVATARTAATVVPLLRDCGMRLPAVVITGAAEWHFDEGRYTDVRYMTPQLAADIDTIFAAEGLHPFVYTLDDPAQRMTVYHGAGSLSPVEQKFVDERKNLPLKKFCLGAQPPRSLDPGRIMYFAMGCPDIVARAARRLRELPECHISHYVDTYNPDTALLEVFAAHTDKARAILALKERLGADRLVVFGDNLNDLPMFRVADTSVAVANALPQVRRAATLTIGPNTAPSVAAFIAADQHLAV